MKLNVITVSTRPGRVGPKVADWLLRHAGEHGKFEIHGDAALMKRMDALLTAFVEQKRMKLTGKYEPCYRIVVDKPA